MLALVLAGCVATQPSPSLEFVVLSASTKPGSCLGGVTDVDKECHTIRIKVTNHGTSTAWPFVPHDWQALSPTWTQLGSPSIEPQSGVPGETSSEATLALTTPLNTHVARLDYTDAWQTWSLPLEA